ncbi:hypothetical protein AB0M02_38160 [Actinoplanes sp. NPDC051861]|uniref:hypothetical protein n=1 Tax=Actinoplanes sp. NPDC051861 TaxID=3155170 RepID=UPI0034326650
MRLADILQILTFLAVLAALVLSYLQVRHVSRQSRIAATALERGAYHALVSNQREVTAVLLRDDPEMLCWHVEGRGFRVRDEAEAKRALYVLMRLNTHEGMFLSWRSGVAGDERWAAWRNVIAGDLAMPGFKGYWAECRLLYTASFARFIDEMIAKSTQQEGGSSAAARRTGIDVEAAA